MTTSLVRYDAIKPFSDFARILDPGTYRPLPADWLIGIADVIDSTGAIAAGRYKTVNMVGAAVIAAVMNALGNRQLPFAFGGDGAGFAIPPEAETITREALGRTVTWAAEEMKLSLRASIVPMQAIRDAGLDVIVSRYAPSSAVSYAMFSGGGMAWAEAQMKQGRFAVSPAPPGSHPDLTGLSCRYAPIPAQQGVVLSAIVVPRGPIDEPFTALTTSLLARLSNSENSGRPVPASGPALAIDARSIDLEARAMRGARGRMIGLAEVIGRSLMAWAVLKFNITFKHFEPRHYRRQTVLNTDFRKFDDGLKLTVDCTPETADAIERELKAAFAQGTCLYGLHRQSEALMTCLVPSPFEDDHMHFIDGAEVAMPRAAMMLKQQADSLMNAADKRGSAIGAGQGG